MATTREKHYWPETGRVEYWALFGHGWKLCPAEMGDGWQTDTFSYLRWDGLNAAPHERADYPPRILW